MSWRTTKSALFLLALTTTVGCGVLRKGTEETAPASVLPATPVSDANYYDDGEPDLLKVELGRLLFFDKVLSGNRNISCATCHHPSTATGDGLSLSVGEGGRGIGPDRDTGSGEERIVARVPRNAPALFNLGAREFRTMFHDGRVEVDPTQPSGFRSPAGNDLPAGLDNVLAAQAMFPVTSPDEMAGQAGENEIAEAAETDRRGGPDGIWEMLSRRLREIPEYNVRFQLAFDDVDRAEKITFVHAANAIAAYTAFSYRADRSPFDHYLRGKKSAMSLSALRGMRLFYGEAGCGSCHSGVFQTDHDFHAIAMPQLGPGKGHGPDGRDDFGRGPISKDPADRYRFRTPSLRNVTLTGPWGHAGAYADLEQAVLHHLDPEGTLRGYDPKSAILPSRPDLDEVDTVVHDDPDRLQAIFDASELERFTPKPRQLEDLLAFLEALTDPGNIELAEVPETVPSGLPVDL